MRTIAIDAMGGDNAPNEIVKGAVEALKEIESNILLIGDEDKIQNVLKTLTYDKERIDIIHTTEIIENEDKPVKAIKSKGDSSMVVGLKQVREKKVDALVSAGNTGALLAGGLLKVGRIKGIERPALGSVYPTYSGISVLIDAGANADCKPRNLNEFGLMGSIYAESVLGINTPKVGLVNIGAEEGKGNSLVIEAYGLLKESSINFIGNVEAREVPMGAADVIVCDGFTGNVILKLSEGVAKSMGSMIKEAFMKNPLTKIAALIVKSGMDTFKKKLDYTEYGGAPLLGVKGAIVKAHGSSNAKAIKNAIKYAERYAVNNVVDKIVESLKS